MQLPIHGTWWIEPGKILGGGYPGTPDPQKSRQMLDALLAMGVRVFVNLQEPDDKGSGGQPFPDYQPVVKELAKARDVQVQFHRFPIRDVSAPSPEVMAQIHSVIRQAVEEGRLVYVHCWGGHGRTGAVAGCWLVGNGCSPNEAIKRMQERRAHDDHLARQSAPQTPEQHQLIYDWPTHLKRK